jgi:uncharacterized membrane protein
MGIGKDRKLGRTSAKRIVISSIRNRSVSAIVFFFFLDGFEIVNIDMEYWMIARGQILSW